MKTYWHQHTQTVDRLAAEYALGTMAAPARRRMDSLMRQRQDIQWAVWAWHERLGDALAAQPPVPADPTGWHRLESRLFASEHKADRKPAWWARWLAPIPAGTLALGLLMGSAWAPLWELSNRSTQLPESYVGVLADADGRPGLIVSSLRNGMAVDLKQVNPPELATGQTLYLWTIDKLGQVQGVSAIPNGKFVSAPLDRPAEATFLSANELAVSIEAKDATPLQPSGPFIYRGLCGKLWKWREN